MAKTGLLGAVVQPHELRALLDEGADLRLVDVRTPAEFESVHIAGSYNMPLDQLPEHRNALSGAFDAPVVLICRSGRRAREAEQLLREIDVPGIHILDGGLAAWEAAGLPVVRGRAHWSIERQVRAIAGALVLLGTLGSLFVWPPLLAVAIFVGAGLLFAGLTDTCMMGMLLARLPYNRGAVCDLSATIAALKAPER